MPDKWIVNFISNGHNEILCDEKQCLQPNLILKKAFYKTPCFIQNPANPTPPAQVFDSRKEALDYLQTCNVDHFRFNIYIIYNKEKT